MQESGMPTMAVDLLQLMFSFVDSILTIDSVCYHQMIEEHWQVPAE